MLGNDETMQSGDAYWWWNPLTGKVGWHPVPTRLWGKQALHRKVSRVVVRLAPVG